MLTEILELKWTSKVTMTTKVAVSVTNHLHNILETIIMIGYSLVILMAESAGNIFQHIP